jgi:hypothetical protein
VVTGASKGISAAIATWGGKAKGEEAIARGQKEATRLAADFDGCRVDRS